jgi:hypothetical protein
VLDAILRCHRRGLKQERHVEGTGGECAKEVNLQGMPEERGPAVASTETDQLTDCFYGQVSLAVLDTAVDIAPGPAEFAEATAVTVTIPDAPGRQLAKPVCVMVAAFGFETSQEPEYGATNGTASGEGGRLNVPVAVNCTCLLAEVAASATAGVMDMERSTRLGLEFAPHPLHAMDRAVDRMSGRPAPGVLN